MLYVFNIRLQVLEPILLGRVEKIANFAIEYTSLSEG